MKSKIDIDRLIEIVSNGGTVKTGTDVFNANGLLLIDKDVLINNINILLNIKKSGVVFVPINTDRFGGLWDENGQRVDVSPPDSKARDFTSVEQKIKKIEALKKDAHIKYQNAKQNIKQVIVDIKKTGGEFDFEGVENTVLDLLNFLTVNENAFTYLTKEIFSYDDYLYNHSINVCTIAVAVMNRFNRQFSAMVNKNLTSMMTDSPEKFGARGVSSYVHLLPDDLRDIAVGFFLHDVGKVLIPDEILNKPGRLTDAEFETIKTHSYEKGLEILARNGLHHNNFLRNTVQYHHCALYSNEARCYPEKMTPIEVPIYVKICKLSDIYDAMTSKRVYKDALNPTVVVSEIFRTYADKDQMLQLILHAFIKVVGIYPQGSIVSLKNGQLAYVLDSDGPLILPLTDKNNVTLKERGMKPMDIGEIRGQDEGLDVDRRQPLRSPLDAYDLLPPFLKPTFDPTNYNN